MEVPKRKRTLPIESKQIKHFLAFEDTGIIPSSMSNTTLDIVDYMNAFFLLLDGVRIKNFLERDKCCQLADRYLLAMIFTYFVRAEYSPLEFTPYNFFVALHLAHDIEEDDDELKNEILKNYVGGELVWVESYEYFMKQRDELWKRMRYRAIVSLNCCLKVIQLQPHHSVWQRYRSEVHAGANRGYSSKIMRGKSEMDDICWHCNKLKRAMDAEEENILP